MAITYRKAQLSDKKALIDLGVQLNTFNLNHDLKENLFWDGWESDIDKEVEQEMHNPLITVYVAETEDKVVIGYLLLKNCVHCGHFEVDQLFVKEQYRNQKVGNGLMDLAIDEAKREDKPLMLEVYKTNSKAIRFYEKLGFKEDGIVLRLEP